MSDLDRNSAVGPLPVDGRPADEVSAGGRTTGGGAARRRTVPAPASPYDAHPKDAQRMSQPTDPTPEPTAEPRPPAEEGDPGEEALVEVVKAALPVQGSGQHRTAAPDREAARALFVRLAELPEGSAERVELRNQLVRMHIPLVEHLARRFRNRGEPLDDLTQVATIGLIKSVDRFDHERGVEFSTYATPTIVGEIKRHFRDKGWAVRVPRRLQELRLSLTTATSELSQRHGRSPTVHELAEHLGISEEDVLEGLESANAYSTLSLDVPDSDDESPAVADTLGATDEALEGVEYRESLKPLLAQLPQREQKILVLRFFRNMTQSQIAAEVGISQMHVSRLLARTLAQLRDKLLVEE
ncbi:SigB/SigF/SigG family RNA polymerase sigma factor [Kitasatospora sp. NBC_01266]|uniref:SigB/SigF/SigG family RNA polymerase sigma factor n=1 Tax=Kitasatospora sp. NBC_01266 TaxID=2903572 RepID=UPI002E3183A9|nr:SigB/SigF/SigG family RNA polymerase sigma factor [Kitasatospora sp. NBC_01266]